MSPEAGIGSFTCSFAFCYYYHNQIALVTGVWDQFVWLPMGCLHTIGQFSWQSDKIVVVG